MFCSGISGSSSDTASSSSNDFEWYSELSEATIHPSFSLLSASTSSLIQSSFLIPHLPGKFTALGEKSVNIPSLRSHNKRPLLRSSLGFVLKPALPTATATTAIEFLIKEYEI